MRSYIITDYIDKKHFKLYNGRYFDYIKKDDAFSLAKRGFIVAYSYEDGIKKLKI